MKGARIRVVFVCRLMAGSKEDDPMATESRLFADILQYRSRLPTDFLAALIWIQRTCSEPSPDFIVRTTPAAFINLPTLLTTADHLPPGLHGTALHTTTPAFLDGLIAQPKDNLLLARHTQYLPAEFVLIKTASSAFLDLIPKIPFVPEEAFFLTGIVADYAELERFRLENVEQTWNGRSGCWINHRSAFLRMKPAEMEELWRALTRVAEFACRQGDGCCEDGWGDIVTSVVIGSLVLVIAYSLLHSYFWSQLSLFCSDICSTVDLDGDEYDDSPELSAVHYDSDREEVVQGQGDTFMGFSGTKAYMQDRF
ncbi:uncharacterized protein LOC129602352 [Paramacrobiotus metropolitanus]|uniref:uncharacterized protein LOC129602352 n=1 Tax=Paramacrobiotus metropolitanus TaxID=2943436 RepID=UPI002445F0B6|nr:uncharacterized protein LOC129602352 [Paramacrobiotus metropolitanus]